VTTPIDSNIINLAIYQQRAAGVYTYGTFGSHKGRPVAEEPSSSNPVPAGGLPSVSPESEGLKRDLKTVNDAAALVQVSLDATRGIREKLDLMQSALEAGGRNADDMDRVLAQIDEIVKNARYEKHNLIDGEGDEFREIFLGLPEAEGPEDSLARAVSSMDGQSYLTLAFTGPDGVVRPLLFPPDSHTRVKDMAGAVDLEFSDMVDARWDEPGGILVEDKKPGKSRTEMKLVQNSEVLRRSKIRREGGLSHARFDVAGALSDESLEIPRRDLTVSGLELNPPTFSSVSRARNRVSEVEAELSSRFTGLTQMGTEIFKKSLDDADSEDLLDAGSALDLSRFTTSRIKADSTRAAVSQANTSSDKAASLLR
jgi:hypothetical protein